MRASLEISNRPTLPRGRAGHEVVHGRTEGVSNGGRRDERRAEVAVLVARVWLEIVQIALDLPAWMPMLALNGKARLWEPRRLRLRLFGPAGQLVTTGRRQILRLARHWPWTHVVTSALERLHQLPNPVRPVAFPSLRAAPSSPGAVESGAHPTRQPGYWPARRQPRNAKRSADSVGRPS